MFYVVTVAGVVGLMRRWREPTALVLIALGTQFAVVSLLLVAPPRLRTPFDVICCIGVGLLASGPPGRPLGARSNGGP